MIKISKFNLIIEFLKKEGYTQRSAIFSSTIPMVKNYVIGNDPTTNRFPDIDTAFWIRVFNGLGNEFSIEGKEENTHIWLSRCGMHKRIDLIESNSLNELRALLC